MLNINLSIKEILWIILGIFFVILVIIAVLIFDWGRKGEIKVSSFEDCIKFTEVVAESYPRQCNYNDKNYVENIGNELDKVNLIQINSPRPNQNISSPIIITGQARGNWFFEGSFPIILEDGNGKQLISSPAKALGEWMTTSFVPFSAELSFNVPETATGTLILKRDNPSGLPENDDELVVPISFSMSK